MSAKFIAAGDLEDGRIQVFAVEKRRTDQELMDGDGGSDPGVAGFVELSNPGTWRDQFLRRLSVR